MDARREILLKTRRSIAMSIRCVVLLIVLTATLVLAPGPANGSSAKQSTEHELVQPRSLALEVCEEMVRTAVESITGSELTRPQEGRWRSRRYVCDFFLEEGELRLTVNYTEGLDASRGRFATRKDAIPRRTELFGIGGEAFQDVRSKVIVARKDNFVLTVDPTGLDISQQRRDLVALAATRAVFDCW